MPLNRALADARLEQGCRQGLLRAGEHLRGEAVERCPVEHGPLRNSARVHELAGLRVAVSFGGENDGDDGESTNDYAVVQHEALEFRHPNGGQAKYLEEPLMTERNTLLRLMGASLREVLA